jgi:hypothetical protein
MWNSNSLISWLIVRSGLDIDAIHASAGGRAPAGMLGLSWPAANRWVQKDGRELTLPLRTKEGELKELARHRLRLADVVRKQRAKLRPERLVGVSASAGVEVEPEEHRNEHGRHHQTVLEEGEVTHRDKAEPTKNEKNDRQHRHRR